MTRFPSLLITGMLSLGLGACAQVPEEEHSAHHPAAQAATAAPAPGAGQPADMAAHMKAMQDLRARMAQARTPEERRALMEEHMKLMREGMRMMDDMRSQGGVGGMMGGRMGMSNTDLDACRQMMTSHMEMMGSMMQMMDGQWPATTGR